MKSRSDKAVITHNPSLKVQVICLRLSRKMKTLSIGPNLMKTYQCLQKMKKQILQKKMPKMKKTTTRKSNFASYSKITKKWLKLEFRTPTLTLKTSSSWISSMSSHWSTSTINEKRMKKATTWIRTLVLRRILIPIKQLLRNLMKTT